MGNELAAGVFVDGPDGVETGLHRSRVDRDVDVVVDSGQASLSLWFAETVTSEGGGFNSEVSKSAVICVEYVVDLDGGDTAIHESACPEDVPSGDHVAQESLGSKVEIDSHDAMRALNRFPTHAHDRIKEYAKTAPAKEELPAATAALQPLTEQDDLDPDEVIQALEGAGMGEYVTTRTANGAVRFGAAVTHGGCIFGLVAPGELDIDAGGVLADGGCLKPH
ncbi:hypothetical protein [Phytoactinopolyspora endophytica]|uniref:hypothetical protein n=1 Tax=Phytoactinopolyspora endophytica TaxID=1642495 RepID=UPI00101C3430|nr:hypothetical protein [Phytoactinopolyspora endophytica]